MLQEIQHGGAYEARGKNKREERGELAENPFVSLTLRCLPAGGKEPRFVEGFPRGLEMTASAELLRFSCLSEGRSNIEEGKTCSTEDEIGRLRTFLASCGRAGKRGRGKLLKPKACTVEERERETEEVRDEEKGGRM